MAPAAMIWNLYILRCGDGSYYTGIALDVARRLREHQEGRGAKYTRNRGPLVVVYVERLGVSRSEALRRECRVKAMSRARKELLIGQGGGDMTKPNAKPMQHEPKVGDVYKDKDRRGPPRYLRVTSIDGQEATCANRATRRVTKVSLRTLRQRFTFVGRS